MPCQLPTNSFKRDVKKHPSGGAENIRSGLDFSTRGRNVSVIFGDGAGAVVTQPTENRQGILSHTCQSDGQDAELLAMYNPGNNMPTTGSQEPYAAFDDAPHRPDILQPPDDRQGTDIPTWMALGFQEGRGQIPEVILKHWI